MQLRCCVWPWRSGMRLLSVRSPMRTDRRPWRPSSPLMEPSEGAHLSVCVVLLLELKFLLPFILVWVDELKCG